MISVVLVDDQEWVRTGLRLLLGRDPDIKVAREADSGRSALRLVYRTTPDVG